MARHLFCAAVAAALLGGAGLSVAEDGCPCREISLGYTSGHIDGYPQGPANVVVLNGYAPLAGRNFNDLGFDGFHQWNFDSHYDYGRNRFYLDYDRTRMSKDYDFPVPTAEDFEDVSLPPSGFLAISRPLHTSIQLDYYRLGYQRLFELEWFGRRLTLAPGMEMEVLDFDYRVESDFHFIPVDPDFSVFPGDILDPGDFIDSANPPAFTIDTPIIGTPISVIRPNFTKWGLRIGGEADYQLSERLSLTAELYDTAPIDDWPDVFTAMLGVRYRLFSGGGTSIYLFARGGVETFKLDRDETPWNDLRAEYTDLIQGGVTLRF